MVGVHGSIRKHSFKYPHVFMWAKRKTLFEIALKTLVTIHNISHFKANNDSVTKDALLIHRHLQGNIGLSTLEESIKIKVIFVNS